MKREDTRNNRGEDESSTHYCNNKNELIHINQCPYCPCRDKYTYIEQKKTNSEWMHFFEEIIS